jgi:hypothetical protein
MQISRMSQPYGRFWRRRGFLRRELSVSLPFFLTHQMNAKALTETIGAQQVFYGAA